MCVAIRNDQYLFREGPGRGEISPQDPLETRLYDANGNIYDKDNPFEVRVRKLEEILGLAEENPEQYTLAARLKRIEDMLESGSAKVTLTGSVQELTVVQSLALTDTSYTLENIDVSMFRQWDFRVVSTLNQRVRLKLYAGSRAIFNTGFRYTYLSDNREVSSKSLELTVPWTIGHQERTGSLGSQVPEVFHAPVNPITTLSLQILADTAPTSGSISIYIRGVKS